MSIILGIESTAHTFGIGVVKDNKILSNIKHTYTTETGGIIPIEAAKHHESHKFEIYADALTQANIKENQIDAIAFSNAPGLAPLLEGMKFAKELSKKLNVPLIPVNHCIAHLEIGKTTGAKDPVMLYCSGANTQIIAYAEGKYRIFGETLDIGVGNFIDNFARYAGIGFPGGPTIQKLAESKNCKYIELPYHVKGMDVAFSGILTKLKQMLEKMNNLKDNSNLPQFATPFSSLRRLHEIAHPPTQELDSLQSRSQINEVINQNSNVNNLKLGVHRNCSTKDKLNNNNSTNFQDKKFNRSKVNYTLFDLAYSLQETVFAMLVETAERALAHTGKKELLLGGGVACNKRLQEMCRIMCKERGAKLFVPENSLLTDNGAMIAYLGEIEYKSGIKFKVDNVDIKPRQRTDEVNVSWRK
jgi:glycoprotease/Kae1 family metallohydrolase